ncbi:Cof-type HAD-IIB family hydrolase [Psychrilyobacter sp.]|uniref:Cof-type HAD-IIB family hydrolase n=1 Tax=Psychrilyobacter sp. TaxID=2586924 RepID=UPI0030162BD2
MIKAIMLDLDGTLLDNLHRISDTNKKILKKLEDKGIKIFLATGRSYESMRSYHEELNLTTPAICYNGAKIIYSHGNEKEYPVKERPLQILIDIARKYKTHLNIYQHEIWYSENIKNEETKIYREISGLKPVEKDFDSLDEMFSTKVLYIGEQEKLLKIEKNIKNKLGDSVHTTFSKPFFLEILDGNVNKGTAMKNIMEEENIPLSQVIAFGDGLNDKEMLETAGIGVAMDGAFDELKQVADHVTTSNNESGVGEFLKKYL